MEKNAFPNFDLLDSEVYNESSYQLSVPSQPPDIRNWFSSYESQQPIDSCKGEYFFRSQELSESETQDPLEDSRKRKLQEVCLSSEKEQTNLSNYTFARDYPLNSSLEICRKKSTSTDSVIAKKKQSLRHILGDEFLTNCQNTIINQSILPENEEICPRRNKHEEPKNHMMSEVKTCEEQLEKKCQELSSKNSEQKKDHIHHTEEKSNKNNREAGFISAKSRPNVNVNREKKNKNRGNFGNGGQDPGVFRRPLIDKTNHADKVRDGGFRGPFMNKTDIPVDAVPAEVLSSGKWQCPRKKKPYIGPPLKQLGLEQWIRRVS